MDPAPPKDFRKLLFFALRIQKLFSTSRSSLQEESLLYFINMVGKKWSSLMKI